MSDYQHDQRRGPRRPDQPDWREFASSSELLDLAGLEAKAKRLDEDRQKITLEIQRIRERCCQRRRMRDLKRRAAGAAA